MFSERLKELRSEKNMFQEELASILGVSPQAYSNYEVSKRQPDFDTLIKLANLFNVSTDYLLGSTNIKEPIESFEKLGSYSFAGEIINTLSKIVETLNQYNIRIPEDKESLQQLYILLNTYRNEINTSLDRLLYQLHIDDLNK